MKGTYAAVALAVAVALAGCPLGGSASGPDPSSFEYPEGFAADGITNGTTAVRTHAESLTDPYRVNFSLRQTSKRGRAHTEGSIEARPSEERSRTEVRQRGGQRHVRVQTFRTESAEYLYRSEGTEFSYDRRQVPFRPPIYPDRPTFVEMLGALELNASAVRASGATQVVIYDVTNVTADRLSSQVLDSNGTVAVDESGTIRAVDVRFTQVVSGVEREVTFNYTTQPGANVSIDRPDWIDEANSQ